MTSLRNNQNQHSRGWSHSPGGVTGGCQDLGVAEEAAAGQVAWEGSTQQELSHILLPPPGPPGPHGANESSPVCASSSLRVLGLAALMLYTVQMLSSPPLATRFPEGAKATLITQADFSGTATNCGVEGKTA